MVATADIQGVLQLDVVGPDQYRAGNIDVAHGVVFGGQLMAQSVVAALTGHEGKAVKTLHTIFARAASPDQPLEISVDRIHSGRSFASSTVTITQQEKVCTRSSVLLSADEPDFIHYAEPYGSLGTPPAGDDHTKEWQVQVVGDVDLNDPDAVGPPELDVWTRFSGATDDVATNQALLAYATDGFLIATAMRPHKGVGQAQSHKSLSTGVLSHTITFHEPFRISDWVLLAHESPFAGHGRSYGRADVYSSTGTLIASYVQDNMIRPMPAGRSGGL